MSASCEHCGAPKVMHWPPALARCPQVSGRHGFYRPKFGEPVVTYVDDKPVARGRHGFPDTFEPISGH
jgi:hypothetical protein